MTDNRNNLGSTHGLVTVQDANSNNWIDRFAPSSIVPFLRLSRLDRPIGIWLLLWPCLWGVGLSGLAMSDPYPNPLYMFLFAIGAVIMRSAGCAYNDIIDRNIDAKVARTKTRPLPSGQLTLKNAWLLFILLNLAGLAVLLFFNDFTIKLAISSVLIILFYPFAKRFTYWPQVVLGLAFAWGALLGWSANFAALSLPPVLLYIGAVFWTMAYDTIYACQDVKDDCLIGVKSTAIKFGAAVPYWVIGFYVVATALILTSGLLVGGGVTFSLLLLPFIANVIWQMLNFDPNDSASCLKVFRSNRYAGGLVFMALIVRAVLRMVAW